jgi:HK97 family phage portal protein
MRLFGKKREISKAVTDPIDNDVSGATGGFDEIFARAQRNARQLSIKDNYLQVAPIRNAISKIADNAARARFRIFDRQTGQEVVGGDLYKLVNRPNRYMSEYQLKQAIYSWYLLTGEYAVFMPTGKSDEQSLLGTPKALVVLDPFRLRVAQPQNPRDLSEVTAWEYHFPNGAHLNASSSHMLYGKNFSLGGVRGLSPILSGRNEIASYFYAWDHVAGFFENSAMPSAIVNVPESMSPQSLDRMRHQFAALFGGKGKHGVLFAKGDYKISNLQSQLKDALADKLIEMSEQDVYKLYSVPPIISGDWNNAKYDAATEQLESFAENTLLPMLQNASDVFQSQLVDRYDWRSDIKGNTRSKALSPLTKAALEKNLDIYAESRFVCMFDPETLPIMGKLARQRIDMALKLINEGQWSSNEAFAYIGIDTPINENSELRDRVYISNALTPISSAEADDENPTAQAATETTGDAVERTALNGAQIASLVLIAERVAEGIIPREAGRLFALLSFPLADRQTISDAFSELVEGIAAQRGEQPAQRQPEEEAATITEAEKALRDGCLSESLNALEAKHGIGNIFERSKKAAQRSGSSSHYEQADLKRARRCLNELRKATLVRAASGKKPRLRDYDEALDGINAVDAGEFARSVYRDVSQLIERTADSIEAQAAVKAYFNTYPRESTRNLARSIHAYRSQSPESNPQDG